MSLRLGKCTNRGIQGHPLGRQVSLGYGILKCVHVQSLLKLLQEAYPLFQLARQKWYTGTHTQKHRETYTHTERHTRMHTHPLGSGTVG